MDNLSFEIELINTFISETKEMLVETEVILIQLEKNPSDFSQLDKLLRYLHTIKGSAGVVGLERIVKFTHIFETLLIEVKNKKIEIVQKVTDTLLAGNDLLTTAIQKIEADLNVDLNFLNDGYINIESLLSGVQLKNNESVETLAKEKPKKQERAIKGHILVVDDETEIADFIKQVIENESYHVYTKDNGKEALEFLKENEVDVIFTDLKMPKMDGYLFTQKLREINLYIPVILISGNLDLDYAKSFLRLGVTDFIDKPFKFSDIIIVLEKAMNTRNLWKELLKISKACFKTYVYVQKLDCLLNSVSDNGEYLNDRAVLQKCLEEIKISTSNLLNFEKDFKNN